jgi:hypothetical protein
MIQQTSIISYIELKPSLSNNNCVPGQVFPHIIIFEALLKLFLNEILVLSRKD